MPLLPARRHGRSCLAPVLRRRSWCLSLLRKPERRAAEPNPRSWRAVGFFFSRWISFPGGHARGATGDASPFCLGGFGLAPAPSATQPSFPLWPSQARFCQADARTRTGDPFITRDSTALV